MNTSDDIYGKTPAASDTENEGAPKEDPKEEKGAPTHDGADLAGERERLVSGIESLEEENHSLSRKVKELRRRLSEKRESSRTLNEKSDSRKKKLVGSLAKERILLDEIEFYESEKSRLNNEYQDVSEQLDDNISSLDYTVKSIEFLKGEVKAVMDKMGMIEEEIPLKFDDVENLDKKFSGTVKTLQGLFDRMQSIEMNAKISYYKNKKKKWSSYGTH